MTQPLKQKWSNFITRLSFAGQHPPTTYNGRRPSQASCCSNSGSAYTASLVDESEHASWSDTMSTISEWSATSTGQHNHRRRKHSHHGKSGERFLSFSSLFRRRGSNASTNSLSGPELEKAAEQIHSLYSLAVDEINYAEDSKGSSYYSGDRVTAREAIDCYANALIKLVHSTTDPCLRSTLQTSLESRLIELEEKYDALPPSN